MVSFKDAVWIYLREKYVTFSGRAPRSEYWWFFLFVTLGYIILGAITIGLAFGNLQIDPSTGLPVPVFPVALWIIIVIAGIFWLAVFLPTISVTVRRFHDRNLSGWWVLAVFVVPGVFSALGTEIPGILIYIASLVVCVLRGTDGPNKYGTDPLKPAAHADVFA